MFHFSCKICIEYSFHIICKKYWFSGDLLNGTHKPQPAQKTVFNKLRFIFFNFSNQMKKIENGNSNQNKVNAGSEEVA